MADVTLEPHEVRNLGVRSANRRMHDQLEITSRPRADESAHDSRCCIGCVLNSEKYLQRTAIILVAKRREIVVKRGAESGKRLEERDASRYVGMAPGNSAEASHNHGRSKSVEAPKRRKAKGDPCRRLAERAHDQQLVLAFLFLAKLVNLSPRRFKTTLLNIANPARGARPLLSLSQRRCAGCNPGIRGLRHHARRTRVAGRSAGAS